jgi:hypothetical protein
VYSRSLFFFSKINMLLIPSNASFISDIKDFLQIFYLRLFLIYIFYVSTDYFKLSLQCTEFN